MLFSFLFYFALIFFKTLLRFLLNFKVKLTETNIEENKSYTNKLLERNVSIFKKNQNKSWYKLSRPLGLGVSVFDFLLITLVNNFHAYVSIYVAL